jgi:2-haloacid dehalogenase
MMPGQLGLTEFRVLSFDCYGTLIDWESGLLRALDPTRTNVRVNLSDEEVLTAFARHESAQQAETPAMLYSDVLAAVHRRLCDEWGIPATEAQCHAFGESLANWPAFPDTIEALRYLKRYYKLVVLSNVDRRSFARTRDILGIDFDAVYTAEDIGSYKPNIENFHYLLTRLAAEGYGEKHILHVAQSLFHDHVPAKSLGLTTAWIDRYHGKPGAVATPPAGVTYDFRFTSLEDLAQAHRGEFGT